MRENTSDINECQEIDSFFAILKNNLDIPNEMLEFSKSAFLEHKDCIFFLTSRWYTPQELYFKDYLSGPKNEILNDDLPSFLEALSDPRYDLIPCIIFKKDSGDSVSDEAKNSALWIEFHRNGNAF